MRPKIEEKMTSKNDTCTIYDSEVLGRSMSKITRPGSSCNLFGDRTYAQKSGERATVKDSGSSFPNQQY